MKDEIIDEIKRIAYAVYETDTEITLRVLNSNPNTTKIKNMLIASGIECQFKPNERSAQTHFIVIKK